MLKSVDIENFTFHDTTITVFPEMVVAWTNKDPVIHPVTSLTGAFDSGHLNSEETFQFTFRWLKLQWQLPRLKNWSAQLIANGVYLYAITARDLQGRMLSRTLQKFIILR